MRRAEPPAQAAGKPRRHLEYPDNLWIGMASSPPEILEFRTDSG